MSDQVTTRQEGPIVEIVLNRPAKRNAINLTMMQALDAAITEVEKTEAARAVIIRGEGNGFSSGIDLKGFPSIAEVFGENWQDNLFPVTAYMQGVLNRIEQCRLPVIGLLHGFCFGLGLELALVCDLRIATESTTLGFRESRIGLIPDVGGTTRLTRLVGPARAKELIMTGRDFGADFAERWGIVNHVVAEDGLVARGRALADELVAAAPLAVSYAKRIINGIADIERGLQLEAWAQSVLIRTEDFANGAAGMLTNDAVEWKGR